MMLKILILNMLLSLHPVHVTLTTINQDPGSDTLELFFRMYVDDFKLDYKKYYPDFNPGKDNDTADYPREMLNRYFNDRVRIWVNNKLLNGNITEVTINSYEITINLDYHSYRKPKTIKVSNQVLVSIYSDQANMVYLSINNYEDAVKLTADNVEKTIRLK
jgi:hypothetical protein